MVFLGAARQIIVFSLIGSIGVGLIVLATRVDRLLKIFQQQFKFLFREDDKEEDDEEEIEFSEATSTLGPSTSIRIDVAAGTIVEPGDGVANSS